MNLFEQHRAKLYNDMEQGDFALFFSGKAPISTADSLYPFRPDKNFYYMTGLKREGFILLMAKGEEEKTTLFVDAPNEDVEKWIGRFLSVDYCKEVTGITDVVFLDTFEQQFNSLIQTGVYGQLFLDLDRVFHDRPGHEAHRFANKVQQEYPQITIKNADIQMRLYRSIKSDEEIQLIKEAIGMTKVGLEGIMKVLKPGDYEMVPAETFRYHIMMAGADGNAFETIAASGVNATVLHYIENDDVMKDGDLILMDLGAQNQEYASDITRTYPISGKYTARQKAFYDLVLEAHEAVIQMMKPGVPKKDLNKKVSEVLATGLKKLGLIKEDSELSQYYYHGVSHSMGLDTHDITDRTGNLEAGMVMTVEPGLYIAEENIGIRIEDDVLITEDGCEVLSADIIRTTEDIEAFMAQTEVK